MSAELYERQMAWKEFVNRRSDEQGRAILAEACRRRPPSQQDNSRREKRRSNSLRSNCSSTSSSTSTGNSRSRGSESNDRLPASCPSATPLKAATGRGRAQERCRPQHHQRNAPHPPSPAPSYSNMLAARRTAEAATTATAKSPPEVTEGKRGESESDSASAAKKYPLKAMRPASPCRQAVGDHGHLENVSGPKESSNAAAATKKAQTATTTAAAATTTTVAAATAAASLGVATGAVIPPPPPPPRRPVSPTAGRDGRGGGDGTRRSPGHADARKSTGGRSARKRQQQGGKKLLPTPEPEHDCQGHPASGSIVVSAAAAPAAAADGTEGQSACGDDGIDGRVERVVGKRPLAVDSADLARKEQAWSRERAQLLTVIKLQHKQLLRSSERRFCSSPPASDSKNAADCSGSGTTSTTASTSRSTATATPANPDRPGSGGSRRGKVAPPPRCWPSSSPPSRLETPPPPLPAKERVAPAATPKTSIATATEDGDGSDVDDNVDDDVSDRAAGIASLGCGRRRDGMVDTRSTPPKGNNGGGGGEPNGQGFVFSTSERSRLLGKVELQREEAARARSLGLGGGGRGPRGAGPTIALGAATAADRRSTAVSSASVARSSGSEGVHGGGNASDDRGRRGGGGGGGGGEGEGTRGGAGRRAEKYNSPGALDSGKGEGRSNAAAEAAAVAGAEVDLEGHQARAPTASCTEGRLQVMERKIEAILRRLGDLEQKNEKKEKEVGRRATPSNQGFGHDTADALI